MKEGDIQHVETVATGETETAYKKRETSIRLYLSGGLILSGLS